MGINKDLNSELNEEDLVDVIGSSIPSNDLPDKFKKYGRKEYNEKDLEPVLGSSIKPSDLPDWAFTEKNENSDLKKIE